MNEKKSTESECEKYSFQNNFNATLNLINEEKYDKALKSNKIGIRCNEKSKGNYYIQRGFIFNNLNNFDSTAFYFNKGLHYKMLKKSKSISDQYQIFEILCRLNRKDKAIKRFDEIDKAKFKKHEIQNIKKIINNCHVLKIKND